MKIKLNTMGYIDQDGYIYQLATLLVPSWPLYLPFSTVF